MNRILAAAATAAAFSAGTAHAAAGTTLENLQAAYNGESNASARYAVFAAKADGDGYLAAGRLFRAASRAEAIHAQSHAKVIRAMGGVPKADLAAPEVKTTRENLQAALAGESAERDTMYPEFLARARQDKSADAVRSLDFARKAEIEHAKLYEAALADLDGQRAAGTPVYVCSVCGYTTRTLPKRCPSSASAQERFERID